MFLILKQVPLVHDTLRENLSSRHVTSLPASNAGAMWNMLALSQAHNFNPSPLGCLTTTIIAGFGKMLHAYVV